MPGHEGSTVHMVPSGEGFEAEAALPVALTTEAGPAGSPPSIQLSLQPTAAGRFTLWARHEETRPEVPAMLLSAFAALLTASPRTQGRRRLRVCQTRGAQWQSHPPPVQPALRGVSDAGAEDRLCLWLPLLSGEGVTEGLAQGGLRVHVRYLRLDAHV